jgi:CHAD domain-containing protein
MSYQLKRELPIGQELKRVILHQFSGVIDSLQQARSGADADAIHDARRHVKKARAALRLTVASLGPESAIVKRRLRRAKRMLGPIADARAVVDTLDRLEAFAGTRLAPSLVQTVRTDLIARAERLERQVEFARLRDRTIRLLAAERNRIDKWTLDADSRGAIIAGVVKGHRRARSARSAAFAQPCTATYHRWRRAVKDDWYLVRLIADHCGGRLEVDERRLAALDECLGDLHNVGLLHDLIARDSPLSRTETAACLLALRAYRRELRYRAHEMGAICKEREKHFARRLNAAWHLPPLASDTTSPRPWPQVA